MKAVITPIPLIKVVGLSLLLALMAVACKHEPFPAPPPGNGEPVDTSDNPIDTSNTNSGKPCHPDTIYYERDIQPILTSSCAYAGCHDNNSAQDGVNLSSYNSVLATADVRPGNPGGSDLYEVIIETDPDKRMPQPPNNPLAPEQIAKIKKWIEQGALNLSCDECDTTNLSYTANIKAIIDRSCINCHSGANPSAGRKLSTYGEVQNALLSTNLLGRINAAAGVPVMPPGGQMDACSIDKIEKWYNDGMPQ